MKLEGIKQTYGKRTVLDIPDFEFESGHIYAVIGSNGCGKSTLSRVICGLLKPTEGKIINGAHKRCAYMPQKSYAFYGTVTSNVCLGLPSGTRDTARVERAIEGVRLTALASSKAKSLSGGETSRLALARIIVGEHDLIVFDEPTASLDVNSTVLAEELIRDYHEKHDCCIILITHSISQALRISDTVLFMSEGRILESGETTRLLNDPQTQDLRSFIEIAG